MITVAVTILAAINIALILMLFWQRYTMYKTQQFLNNFVLNSEAVINAVEKCVDIINKNAELLLKTSEKTNGLEEEVVRLKAVYNLIGDYFSEIEVLNERRRQELPLNKRVYQLTPKEE